MKIEILGRMRPFSRLPGTSFLVPDTEWCVQLFGARLLFRHMRTGEEREFLLKLPEAVSAVSFFLDFERREIVGEGKLYGDTIRYRIFASGDELFFEPLLLPEGELFLAGELLEKKKQIPLFPLAETVVPFSEEILSFGVSKKQELDRLRLRLDLQEFLPLLYRFSELCPEGKEGGHPLLEILEEEIRKGDKLALEKSFQKIYLSLFGSGLVPRVRDGEYSGGGEGKGDPLTLPHTLRRAIRSLFFVETGKGFSLLPLVPPVLHCGRMLGIVTSHGDILSLEWSKKQLKKVILIAGSSREESLLLAKPLESFRLRKKGEKEEKRISGGARFSLEQGLCYFFDRFEK